ncbi:MAG: tetratricopeptide repeat protein [Planctomycetes bacterium]|nr:tetratricopeptide repeat protein [Planctomycetota bacterium]
MQQIIALSLAFAAASLSLVLAGSGKTIAPFGWPAVIVVHALATLPLAAAAAHGACALWPVLRYRWAVVLLVPVGLLLGWLTFQYGGSLGPRLRQHEVGSLLRMAIRMLWPLALQLPWTLLALQRGGEMKEAQPEPPELKPRRVLGLSMAAVAIAVVLPNVYVDDVVGRRMREVDDTLQDGQLAKAVKLLERLEHFGASQALLSVEQQVTMKQNRLKDLIMQQPADPRQADERHFEMAQIYRSLGQYGAARIALDDLPDRYPPAAELMAIIYRDHQQWEESARWFRRATRPLTRVSSDEEIIYEVRRLDSLAYVLRAQRKYGRIEKMYNDAIERLPPQEAYFRFQLGRHYELVGRPIEARRQWEEAARIDPEQFQQPVEAAIAGELNSPTPGCLLGPLRSQP